MSITQEKFRISLLLAFLNLSPTLVKLLLRCFSMARVFLYRELIPGAKKYRYKVIHGANTLEAAIDKSLDAHNALRSEILEHAQEVAIRKAQHQIETNSPRRRARMITENMVRSKKVSIRKYLNNFLDEEQKK